MTRRSMLCTATFALAACLAACSQPPPVAQPDTRAAGETAIRAADADFAKAAAAKDLGKCMALYMDDAVIFSPGTPAVIGKDNIRKFFEHMLAGPSLQFSFSNVTVDVARSGELAEDRGSIQVTTAGGNGKPVTQSSEYVLVWKKQADGSWKVAADTSAPDK
ncbi:MAG TPA: SgcJ/EcaC family oxidoreductase [Candidatus Acidoferrales bacterium]|nr:SgcJ/EcaC family oxidoreductase [Candidatus Acidoferrales bacterium]